MYRTNTHDRSLADQLCRTRHNLPPSPPLVHSNETSYNLSVRERLKKRGCCVIVYYSISIIFRYKYFFFFLVIAKRNGTLIILTKIFITNQRTILARFFLFLFLLAILVCGEMCEGWRVYKHRAHEAERPSLVHGVVSIFFHSTPALFFSFLLYIMYALDARVAFRSGVVRVRPLVPRVINNLET